MPPHHPQDIPLPPSPFLAPPPTNPISHFVPSPLRPPTDNPVHSFSYLNSLSPPSPSIRPTMAHPHHPGTPKTPPARNRPPFLSYSERPVGSNRIFDREKLAMAGAGDSEEGEQRRKRTGYHGGDFRGFNPGNLNVNSGSVVGAGRGGGERDRNLFVRRDTGDLNMVFTNLHTRPARRRVLGGQTHIRDYNDDRYTGYSEYPQPASPCSNIYDRNLETEKEAAQIRMAEEDIRKMRIAEELRRLNEEEREEKRRILEERERQDLREKLEMEMEIKARVGMAENTKWNSFGMPGRPEVRRLKGGQRQGVVDGEVVAEMERELKERREKGEENEESIVDGAMITVEFTTNIVITEETLATELLLDHLSKRYSRPLSSFSLHLHHSQPLVYAGSTAPAYTLCITALDTEVSEQANKRNASMLQEWISEVFGVRKERGSVIFVGMARGRLARGGETVEGRVKGARERERESEERKKKEPHDGRVTPVKVERRKSRRLLQVRKSLTGLRVLNAAQDPANPRPLISMNLLNASSGDISIDDESLGSAEVGDVLRNKRSFISSVFQRKKGDD